MNPRAKILRTIVANASEKMTTISAEEWSAKVNPEKWSKKEILGHLIDSCYNNHQRIIRAESQSNLIFPGYDQNDWVVKNNYQNRSSSEIIDSWVIVHRHMIELICQISKEVLQRETLEHNFHQISMNTVDAIETSSLDYLIWDYIYHQEHHLSQIIAAYERINPDYI